MQDRLFLLVAACGSLGLLGCGGSDATTGPPKPKDIVELAQATATLSTLVSAVVAADLVETLKGDGKFTVFAPTNDAFAALPKGILDALLTPDGKDGLTNLLLYHVVPVLIKAGDLEPFQTPATARADAHLVVIKKGEKVTVNDAEVILADQMATNGVVHIVNKVIMDFNIVNYVAGGVGDNPLSLIKMAQALTQAELDDNNTLQGTGPFTVFAPTDDAFAALPTDVLDDLLKPENKPQLVSLLKYHVITGRVLSIGLDAPTTFETLETGKSLTITKDAANGAVTVGSNVAKVIKADVGVTNGVVHVVNKVLDVPSVFALV